MGSAIVDSISESRTYRVAVTLRRWVADSATASLLERERVLVGALALIVLVSAGSVFRSNLGAGVKFLSFALLFACLAWLTARFLDPLEE